MKKIIKYLIYIVSVVVVCFVAFLFYMTAIDYQPSQEIVISSSSCPDTIDVSRPIRLMTWNIGYAGLDSTMDFFYDGGHKVRPDSQTVKENIEAISDYISELAPATDFFLIEEIDEKAKRSYNQNQLELIQQKNPSFVHYFSTNYDVKWVPIPISDPMGNVKSGIALYTKQKARDVTRHSFPCNFGWPLKVFMLDRCFMSAKYPTTNGKELNVIVTHNSAFDGDGYLRKEELNYLKKYLLNEYEKGNYVIVGGDFNECPAFFDGKSFGKNFDDKDYVALPDTLLPPEWHYAYDSSTPTNRRVIDAYKPLETKVTLIDFFIASPNIDVDSVHTENLNFRYSDHNPVFTTVRLKR